MNAKTIIVEKISKVDRREYNGQDGKPKVLISVNLPYRKDAVTDAQGNKTWNTTFINVAFGGNDLTNKLKKGDVIYVEGEVIASMYKKQDGTTEIQYKLSNSGNLRILVDGDRITPYQPTQQQTAQQVVQQPAQYNGYPQNQTYAGTGYQNQYPTYAGYPQAQPQQVVQQPAQYNGYPQNQTYAGYPQGQPQQVTQQQNQYQNYGAAGGYPQQQAPTSIEVSDDDLPF